MIKSGDKVELKPWDEIDPKKFPYTDEDEMPQYFGSEVTVVELVEDEKDTYFTIAEDSGEFMWGPHWVVVN